MLKPTNLKRSRLQEKRAARDYDGTVQAGSGNQWHSKGDVRTRNFLIECKTTVHQSYSLARQTWEKIRAEATLDDRLPAMEVDISGLSLVVLAQQDFLELVRDSP